MFLDEQIVFPDIDIPVFEPSEDPDVEHYAQKLRELWTLGKGPIDNLTYQVEKHGIIIAQTKIDDKKIDAFSRINTLRPHIFLSTSKSAVRMRFDLAHELGHLLLHSHIDEGYLSDPKLLKKAEKEADLFAAALLLPSDQFSREIIYPSLDNYTRLKQRWGVSIQAMIGRSEQLGIISPYQSTSLYKIISARKMRTNEPLDNSLKHEMPQLLRQSFGLLKESSLYFNEEVRSELPYSFEDIIELSWLDNDFFDYGQGEAITLHKRI